MFTPPRCAHPDCPNHHDPAPRFYVRHGHYKPRCRAHPVPRFRCRSCGRTFSRQSFRLDHRDHKPHLNRLVLELLCSGVGYRQAARVVPLTRPNLEAKMRKLAPHVARLEALQRARIAAEQIRCGWGDELELQMDEFESYEGRRNTRPLSIPVVIDAVSRFRYAAIAAPIRPRGTMTESRLGAIAADEARFGRREDRSREACVAAFRVVAEAHPLSRSLVVQTDCKSTYPGVLREAFPDRQIEHLRTPGSAPRGHGTPLHPINLTEAILRDHVGRLRRESWLVSKERPFLNLHLGMINGYRNWVRPRFNFDARTPAQIAGFAPRRLRVGELLGWRQDWGERSPCPFRGPGERAVEPMAA